MSGPSCVPVSASWHFAQVRNGWKNSTAPRPASPRSRAAFARSATGSFASRSSNVGAGLEASAANEAGTDAKNVSAQAVQNV